MDGLLDGLAEGERVILVPFAADEEDCVVIRSKAIDLEEMVKAWGGVPVLVGDPTDDYETEVTNAKIIATEANKSSHVLLFGVSEDEDFLAPFGEVGPCGCSHCAKNSWK